MLAAPRTVFFALGLILAVIGSVLLTVSTQMDEFTDNAAANALIMADAPDLEPREEYARINREWHTSMNVLRTGKWRFFGAGWTCLVLGAIALGIATLLDVRKIPSWNGLSSPRHRTTFVMLGLLSWLLWPVFIVVDAYFRVYRHDVPMWADTLAIPVLQAVYLTPWILLLGMLFSLPTAFAVRFPARLTAWSSDRRLFSFAVSVPLLLIAAFWSVLFALSVWDGIVTVAVFSALSVYLTLSARAGLISKWASRNRGQAPE